jgi:phosphinothricin acetyltransferase
MMMSYALSHAHQYNIKTLFAVLLETNLASIRLLEKYDFKRWAYLPGVADFNGEEVGQYYYGRRV